MPQPNSDYWKSKLDGWLERFLHCDPIRKMRWDDSVQRVGRQWSRDAVLSSHDMKRRELCMGAMGIAGLTFAGASDAQQFDGTGRWIVGSTAGGGLDAVARVLASRMQDF